MGYCSSVDVNLRDPPYRRRRRACQGSGRVVQRPRTGSVSFHIFGERKSKRWSGKGETKKGRDHLSRARYPSDYRETERTRLEYSGMIISSPSFVLVRACISQDVTIMQAHSHGNKRIYLYLFGEIVPFMGGASAAAAACRRVRGK